MTKHITCTSPYPPMPPTRSGGNGSSEAFYDVIVSHKGITFHFYSLANDATC